MKFDSDHVKRKSCIKFKCIEKATSYYILLVIFINVIFIKNIFFAIIHIKLQHALHNYEENTVYLILLRTNYSLVSV